MRLDFNKRVLMRDNECMYSVQFNMSFEIEVEIEQIEIYKYELSRGLVYKTYLIAKTCFRSCDS